MCLILFGINVLLYYLDEKNKLVHSLISLMGIGGGAVAYLLIVAPHYVSKSDWRYSAAKLANGDENGILNKICNNFSNMFQYIIRYLNGMSMLYKLLLLICILSAWIGGIIIFNSKRNSIKKRISGNIMFFVAPVVMFVFTFIPLVVLNSVGVRCRLFLAFGGFTFYIGVMLLYVGNRIPKAVFTVLAVFVLAQFSCMYAYGNALNCQEEYEHYLIYNIAHDLETVNSNGEFEEISFIGQAPKARQLQKMCEKYPFFTEIVPVYMDNDTWIGGAFVYHYLQYEMEIVDETQENLATIQNASPVIQNLRYSIYTDGNKVLVYFAEDSEK